MAKALDRPRDPVFSSVKVAPSRTTPANVVRSDPFLKPVTQPSQPADTAVCPPATDLSQQKSIAKASSSTQLEPTAPTTAQTVQRQLSTAFDTSRKETPSSSDSEKVFHQTDLPWTSSRKKVNCRMIKKPICRTMTNPSRRNNPTEGL